MAQSHGAEHPEFKEPPRVGTANAPVANGRMHRPLLCTEIGADSGVIFDLDVVEGLAESNLPVRIHACVERTCVTRTTTRSDGPGRPAFVHVLAPSLSHEGPVRVLLQITDWSGQRVFDASNTVRVRKYQPNGPACEPTAYVASVTATAHGELQVGSTLVEADRRDGSA